MTSTARRARLLSLLEEARATGDLSSITYALGHLVHIYLWRGELARGRAYADEHFEVAVHGELQGQEAQARYNLGLAMAYQGQLDDADRHAARAARRPRAPTSGSFIACTQCSALLHCLETTRSPRLQHTDLWHDALIEMHFGEPGYSRSHLDHLCALIGTGRTADADAFCDELDAAGTALRSRVGGRCRVDRTRDA